MTSITTSMANPDRPRLNCSTFRPMTFTTPVRIMARLRKNMAPTVITAGLANPEIASV